MAATAQPLPAAAPQSASAGAPAVAGGAAGRRPSLVINTAAAVAPNPDEAALAREAEGSKLVRGGSLARGCMAAYAPPPLPLFPPPQLWDAPPAERILTHGPPISQMLLLTLPLSQLPPDMIARLAPLRGSSAAAAAPGSAKGGDAAPAEPSRRLLVTGDETGRVKIWDADAIIALSGVPSLTEIVDLALESAKVGREGGGARG